MFRVRDYGPQYLENEDRNRSLSDTCRFSLLLRREGESELFHMQYVNSKRIGISIVQSSQKESSSKETGV